MNGTKIHFAFLRNAPLKDDEREWINYLKTELGPEFEKRTVVYSDDPTEADIIAVLESSLPKERGYLRVLSGDINLQRHWQKVFTINYEDAPMGFLQGLYTSICEPYYRTALHRSWPPLWVPCGPIYGVTDERILAIKPKYAFSFLGSKSHPIRRKILSLYPSGDNNGVYVQDVDKWFNHSEDEKSKYVEISLNSRFVLCPRGHAAFTYRICEAMAMGRVPVVIADQWIPFSFDDKVPYYVQIPEAQVDQIDAILREVDSKAEEYGFNARELWKKYSAPKTRVYAALTQIRKLKDEGTGPKTYGECKRQWSSRKVLSQGGWTFNQRLGRKWRGLMTFVKRKS
jgi:hypothetical protein